MMENTDIKLKPRSSFWLTRILNWFGGEDYFTTIGDTVYYPDWVENPLDPQWKYILEHESHHVKDYKKYGVFLFLFLYGCIFFPVLFAYCRWCFERKAYMVQIKAGARYEDVVDILWSGYLWTWPKPLMKKWFKKEIAKY